MTSSLSLPIGTVLAGDYRIEQLLGAGGFGVTYLAYELAVDRYVTIKEYFPTDFVSRNHKGVVIARSQADVEDYQWGLDRFIVEAKALGRFDHHNIVRLYRYFRANETAYMVLHFEEGQSLKEWLKSLGRAPRQQELDQLVSPLLDALEVIHGADFLHRDIAPDNVIVRADHTPVLIDFGSARGEIATHSRTLSALIKPGYSPYEQYAETGKKQGPWTDIYAFAGTLYFAVTGKRPTDAPSRLLKDELQPAEQIAIGAFRKKFLRAIDKGLRLDMDQRPKSIAAWRKNLLDADTQISSEKSIGWLFKRVGAGEAEVSPAATSAVPVRQFTQSDPAADVDPDLARAGKGPSSARNSKSRLPDPLTKLRNRLQFGRKNRTDSSPKLLLAAPDAKQPAAQPPQALLSAPPKPPNIFKRRVARPRPIRRSWAPRWRPLLFKLLIGFGIAFAAVSLQEKQIARKTNSVAPTPLPAKDAAQNSIKRRQEIPQTLLHHRIVAHQNAISAALFASNGQRIVTVGASDSMIKVWDRRSRALIRTMEMDDGPATALATRGNLALTGHSEGVIVLWDINQGIRQRSFKRNAAPIWALAFAESTGRFWAGGHDWTVALWEVGTPSAPLQVLEGHDNPVQAVSYSSSNALLASGGADKSVKLWNSLDFSQIHTYRELSDFVRTLAFSDDGRHLVAGLLNGNISIMVTTSHRSRRIKAHDTAVVAVKFFSNERFVTAGKDGSIKIWSVRGEHPLVHIPAGNREISAMDVSADAGYIMAADTGGSVTIWRMPE
ncbi:MAG: protein kinase [Pseudomonadota bacterium]